MAHTLPRVGITMGDAAGIGPEITVKCLANAAVYKICDPVVLGDSRVIKSAVNLTGTEFEIKSIGSTETSMTKPGLIHVIDYQNVDPIAYEMGVINANNGKAAVHYTQEAGVRNLERQIARICRKVAYTVATDTKERARITSKNVSKFLGPQKVFHETARRTAIPGVATGLAWTETGGEILFIEVIKMPGKKGLEITGQLGEVMQESVKAALSYVRSISDQYRIDQDFFESIDLHIHIPAGAIPKDGPSAGVAIATAIISALTGRPVKKEIAMSGEVTLSGLVLPVGGIREKVLAAKREGIKKVILPARNRLDVKEIPKELLKGIRFAYIEKIEEGIQLALT